MDLTTVIWLGEKVLTIPVWYLFFRFCMWKVKEYKEHISTAQIKHFQAIPVEDTDQVLRVSRDLQEDENYFDWYFRMNKYLSLVLGISFGFINMYGWPNLLGGIIINPMAASLGAQIEKGIMMGLLYLSLALFVYVLVRKPRENAVYLFTHAFAYGIGVALAQYSITGLLSSLALFTLVWIYSKFIFDRQLAKAHSTPE